MDEGRSRGSRPRWSRALLWVAGTLLLAALCAAYLLATVDWFLAPALEPPIRTWPQTFALAFVLLTPTTALVGAALLGRTGRERPSRWIVAPLAVMAVINLGVAVSVLVDARRPAPEIDREVEEEIPDASGAAWSIVHVATTGASPPQAGLRGGSAEEGAGGA